MIIAPDEFIYVHGEPKSFTRSDKDNAVTRECCAEFGTHIARLEVMLLL